MPDRSDPAQRLVPPSQLVAAACREIVAAHADTIPDLTSIVILVPDVHACPHIARVFHREAGAPVLLLPRIATFRTWSDGVALDRPIEPSIIREAVLYQALAERRWFDHADLWAIAAELSALFDELTRWHVGMPNSVADFRRRLEAAYRVRAGATFAFEARMVCELWHAFVRDAKTLDAEAAYQLRLGRLAGSSMSALYTIGLGVDRLSPAERALLRKCAERLPVVCFDARMHCEPSLGAVEHALVRAWPEVVDQPIGQRASKLRARFSDSVLEGRVSFCAAHGIEHEARVIEIAVRDWLQRGCERVAVVVLDRLTARRARALLERAQVLVRDEVGWAFSTTSASTVISRWFDVCGNDFYHRDMLDFLKSPFVFHDWPRERRQEAVWRLERSIRKHDVRAGLERYAALSEVSSHPDTRAMLHAVQTAALRFDVRRRRPLSEWLRTLDEALGTVGVVPGLLADAAGQQLLTLLRALAVELGGNASMLRFSEFRRWLGRCLESASFRDVGIESPVVFASLAGMHLREFDAVVIAGADALNLSGVSAPGMFFNQTVRHELGLPGHAESMRAVERDLIALIAVTPQVCVTWQHIRDGEPNLLAPVFERLRALHRLAWGGDLDARELAAAARAAANDDDATNVCVRPSVRPAPVVMAEILPATISASSYNALLDCPYQFYAHYVLGLRELDDVQEQIEKADFGNLVHAVLRRFHTECPVVSTLDPEAIQARLLQVSREVFEASMTSDYLARAWLMRWERLVPKYVAWQRDREAAGWRFKVAEVERRIGILTPGGRHFEIVGRIDRVDARRDGAVSVVDYKTQSAKRLHDKLHTPGEDVQLPIYGLLWEGPVSEALFLALDRDDIRAVPLDADVADLGAEVRERLALLLDRICEGAPLPAHGSETVCGYCRAQGLCRKRHWS